MRQIYCAMPQTAKKRKREKRLVQVLCYQGGGGGPGGSSETGLRALLTGSVVRVRHETTPARGSSQQVAARALTTRAFYRSDESLREVTTKPLQLGTTRDVADLGHELRAHAVGRAAGY
jgi:hypothetical protein